MKNWKTIAFCIGWVFSLLIFIQAGKYAASVAGKGDSSFYWLNKYNDLVISQRKTEAEFAKKNKHVLDSVARAFKTKPSSIKEYVIVYKEAKADIEPVAGSLVADYYPAKINCPPVVKNYKQTFASPWYTARVQIGDSSYMHLQARDTIAIVWQSIKTGTIFNRKEYLQANISNTNPDVKMTGLQTYRVAERKPKKFGLGIHVGYGLSGTSPSPYVGLGLSYNIIRF